MKWTLHLIIRNNGCIFTDLSGFGVGNYLEMNNLFVTLILPIRFKICRKMLYSNSKKSVMLNLNSFLKIYVNFWRFKFAVISLYGKICLDMSIFLSNKANFDRNLIAYFNPREFIFILFKIMNKYITTICIAVCK